MENAVRVVSNRAQPLERPGCDTKRAGIFLRLPKLKLRSGNRKTGIYSALMQVGRGSFEDFTIILSDLQISNGALVARCTTRVTRVTNIIVAQIGAPWRLAGGFEKGYVEYQSNNRILRRLEDIGLTTFDLRPEVLIETVGLHASKSVPTVQVTR